MRAGPLRHIVDVERKVVARDSFGGETITWTPVLSGVYAELAPLSGREYLAAGDQHKAEADVRITLRGHPGVTLDSTMRVVHGAQIYELVHVRNDRELGHMLELLAKTGSNQG